MEHIGHEMGVNLWHNSLVYFPRTLIEELQSPEEGSLLDFTNRLLLLDKYSGAYFVDNVPVTLKVMQKSVMLGDNMFKLLQYRERFPDKAFTYLVKKYMDQILGFLVLAEWFLENASTDIPEISREHYNGFKIQRDSLRAHLKELEENFGITVKDQAESQELKAIAFEALEKNLLPHGNIGDRKKPDRAKRLRAIREKALEEAERHIMKQIFNVKFNED